METTPQEKLMIHLKLSSNVVANTASDGKVQVNTENLAQVGEQIRELKSEGHDVLVYTSGAIAVGMAMRGIKEEDRPDSQTQEGMTELQELFTVGQVKLMRFYEEALPDFEIGEMLLTQNELHLDDAKDPIVLLEERRQAINVASRSLSRKKVVLFINENNAVAHKNISFGDNDFLSATGTVLMHLSQMFNKKPVLVMLGVKDGILRTVEGHQIVIPEITLEQCKDPQFLQDIDTGESTVYGTGGVSSKLEAGGIVTSHGIDMFVASGLAKNAVKRALNRDIGTHFVPNPRGVYVPKTVS
jgi:glutamate 5-kinase